MIAEEIYKDLIEVKKQLSITKRALEIASENYCRERSENFKGHIDTVYAVKQFSDIALSEYYKKEGL